MTLTSIDHVTAWEAFDSRGQPTVGCRVRLRSGVSGATCVPSGASTGTHEATDLRDGGDRYGGRGTLRAIASVRDEIAPRLLGADAENQAGIDGALEEIDGTPGFGRLGGNAVLAVSVAVALAAASHHRTPLYRRLGGRVPLLPLPMVNILSGGAHAAAVIDVQDFLVIPIGAASFAEAMEMVWRVRRSVADIVAVRGHPSNLVADEGGVALPLDSNRAGLDLLVEGVERAGLHAGHDVVFAVDVAANQLLDGDHYRFAAERRRLTADELVDELAAWRAAYPLWSIEDPLADDDWPGWAGATRRLAGDTQLLGDDLFVTDRGRIRRGVDEGVANAVLVKPNQTGTLSRALAAVETARAAGYATVVSARSGDTEDAWLADLAVGWRAGQIKVGSLTRSERTAKWNRLLEIEATDPAAVYRGAAAVPLFRDLAGRRGRLDDHNPEQEDT